MTHHPVRRRVAALVALVAAGAALLTAVTFPFAHFPTGIAAFGLAIAGGPLAWEALVRHGIGRWARAALATLAFAGALWILIADGGIVDVITFAATAAIAVAAARVAVRSDRATIEAARPARIATGPARRGVLIVNPKSGGGKAERLDLAGEARRRGVHPVVLEPGQDLAALARAALHDGADVIGMAGGDGSQALVAALAAERDIPYVCVPAGTRNHLALDLGVDRSDAVGALDAFLDGRERRVDLAVVNDRVFVNNVSLGLYARIVQSGEYRDAKLETMARLLPEMLRPDAEPFGLRFTGPFGLEHDSAVVILVSNNPYRFAPGGFGTRPALDTGRLGLVVATEIRPGEQESRGPAWRSLGGRFGWMEWDAPEFEIDADGPVDAGIDGEALTLDAPLRFASRPGALRVRLAPGHPGVSPAALAPALSARSIVRLAFGRA